jgi:aminopeptidase N
LHCTSHFPPTRDVELENWLGNWLHHCAPGANDSKQRARSGYQLVYFKGGYVLHMLRMMLHDFARNDDSRFIAMMREFASTFQNRNASTEDFKAIVDRHFRADMRWFFDQWVYGTEVPKITVEYSLTDSEQGAMFAGTLRQRGVSPEFRVIMPVVFRFKAGGAVARITATGAATPSQFQLPERPESVEFNPLDAVLCELEVKRM